MMNIMRKEEGGLALAALRSKSRAFGRVSQSVRVFSFLTDPVTCSDDVEQLVFLYIQNCNVGEV